MMMMTKKNLAVATEKADGGCKSFAARPVLAKKKQSPLALPKKLSQNPKSKGIKKNLKNPPGGVCKSVSTTITTSRPLQMKKPSPLKVSGNPKYCRAVEKNAAETLELFDIAKKSADVANAKGLLAAKEETSICVDTLSLLIGFPISSTDPETRRIMERLAHLTRHKDRRICNSASDLFHHWSQIIRDQTAQRSPCHVQKHQGS